MARTVRRRGCRYDYPSVLWRFEATEIDSRSIEVVKCLARWHSDGYAGHRIGPPKAFRAVEDSKLRLKNRAALRLWLKHPDFEVLFCDIRHCPAWMPW